MAAMMPACDESPFPSPAPAPIICEIDRSANACFRCQAQRCGAQLDRCYGQGFHEGRAVGTTTERCLWNADTGKYDRNCTFSGGLSKNVDAGSIPAGIPDVPCGLAAVCFQLCGCGSECQAGCADARRTPITSFANDPRGDAPSCTACESAGLAACVSQSCAAECAPADAGAGN